ncbi:AAA family ATPase [Acidovorax lacteus]|uniref:Protein kinase domain-containing protein n=1 Tax=Acidovorax lacteus TaxID=1924988 RepID=A0ABP8LKS0_9BURK
MWSAALATRFDALTALHAQGDLVVARATHRGQPVLLWHRSLLDEAAIQAGRIVAERLRQGQCLELLECLEGPSGVTWVVPDDGALFLDEWMGQYGPVPLATAVQLLQAVAEALDALHRNGVLHLHLRPTTVRVQPGTPVRVALLPVDAVPMESASTWDCTAPGHDARYGAPELSGRTANRPGPRTDLYLLGLLAYEVLTGRLPFDAVDALEWWHAHLAVPAPEVSVLRPELPRELAELVAALLSKSPEQRPASTAAVARDLRACVQGLASPQPGQAVALRSPRALFAQPRLLLGREAEMEALQQALDRVSAGRVEQVCLTGPAGIGKSALAARFLESARLGGARVLSAKCQQQWVPRPYPVVAALLDDLASQGRALPRGVLGPEAAALVALSPDLAAPLGLPVVGSALPPEQARQRLLTGLVQLLAALVRDQTLVLWVDDAHWSDPGTLSLLDAVLSDRALQRILLLVGLRSDETGAAPARAALASLPGADMPLSGLQDDEMQHWVEAALPGGLAHPAATLARLAQRSAGNPLFLGQLLDAMVAQGQLVPAEDGRWVLDDRASGVAALPASALEAAAARLRVLHGGDAWLLGLAAAHGGEVDAALLAAAAGRSPAQVEATLLRAQAEGLVEPTRGGRWRFLHDRLQQAAYQGADEPTRQQWHRRLGETLLDRADDGALFEMCRHLALALPLLSSAQRHAFVLASQRAARQAGLSAAFVQQVTLLRGAVAALDDEGTLDDVARRGLLFDAAEALVLARDFEQAAQCLGAAERLLASDTLAQARADELRIGWLVAQERGEDALALGVQALGRVGLRIHPARASLESLWHWARLQHVLRSTPQSRWAAVPVTTDALHIQTDRLIFASISVAHTLASPLYAVLGLVGARLALQRGFTPWSWQPISGAAHVLSGVFNDIDTGHALGELSVQLGDRLGTHSLSFNHLFYVMHWKVPVASTLPLLRHCFEQAERSGNFEIAGYAAGMLVGVTWNAMGSLTALDEVLHEARAFAKRRDSALVRDCCDTFDGVLQILRGAVPRSEIAPLQRRRTDGRVLPHDAIFALIHDQLAVMLNVMAGFTGDAVVACGQRVRRNLHRLAGNFSTPLHHWFEALLHADRLRERSSRGSRRLVQRHLSKLRTWAAHCPANHAHRVLSLEAELAALAADTTANSLFERALQTACEHGFTGDAAILAHRWARHCARSGHPDGLRVALERAHALYSRWGAACMVEQIEASLPTFARPRHDPPPLPLDTATLIKASQAIGTELEMGAVAERLLQQVMENAGARYGALLLQRDDRLVLAAQRSSLGARVEPPPPAALERTGLPQALLRAMVQGREPVVLEDACAPHAWGVASRWEGQSRVSVLCVPVVAAGRPLGVLYLENELSAACFTPDRAAVARVLAAQAAVSLANARLYAELSEAHDELQAANQRLEERVRERTHALEANHAQMRRLERQHAADEERQRIMRDLHDGLGSQLFVMLSRVEREDIERGEISDALRACIADMRLVLEAMGSDGHDFLAAWGSFRFRWDAQLRAAGLQVRWRDEIPHDTLELAPTTGLQVLRVVQEALTNVLKHAHAQNVDVHIAALRGALRVTVRDDGCGIREQAGPASRGLANMRARASRVGGELRLEPLVPGTCVVLELPVAR